MNKINQETKFQETKEQLQKFMDNDYENFVKSLISIETNICDFQVLTNIYENFMKDDNIASLINDNFQDMNDFENKNENIEYNKRDSVIEKLKSNKILDTDKNQTNLIKKKQLEL